MCNILFFGEDEENWLWCEQYRIAAIRYLITKFSLSDIKPLFRIRTVRTEEIIAVVVYIINGNCEMSILNLTQKSHRKFYVLIWVDNL